MIKVDLITGFLGSGKTTFIKKYVRYLIDKGEKIGIIENDYGAINVDMMLLNEEFENECNIEMVVAADPDCHRRRFKTKLIAMGMDAANEGRYDRVIVEPSGIYDVDEFFDILYEEPLDRFYKIGNVIAIVDAGLSDDLSKESDYLLVSQIAEAGMVVFSKVEEENVSDGMSAKQDQEKISDVIEHMNRALERFKCKRRFEFHNDSVSGDMLIKPWANLTADDFGRVENCGYIPEDHIKIHVAEENGYKSLFYYHVKMSGEELEDFAKGLFEDDSLGDVYRIKGFVPVGEGGSVDTGLTETDDGCCKASDWRYIQINATREYTELNCTENGQEVIIVIGENLDNEKIERYIRSFSHEEDITAGQSNHTHK